MFTNKLPNPISSCRHYIWAICYFSEMCGRTRKRMRSHIRPRGRHVFSGAINASTCMCAGHSKQFDQTLVTGWCHWLRAPVQKTRRREYMACSAKLNCCHYETHLIVAYVISIRPFSCLCTEGKRRQVARWETHIRTMQFFGGGSGRRGAQAF